jgi:hypothetical protein
VVFFPAINRTTEEKIIVLFLKKEHPVVSGIDLHHGGFNAGTGRSM